MKVMDIATGGPDLKTVVFAAGILQKYFGRADGGLTVANPNAKNGSVAAGALA